MTYSVRRIGFADWRELRAIRLEALVDTPTAFSSSYAEVAARTDAFWQEKCAAAEDSAIFVACDENGDWTGTASAEPLAEVPDHAHIHAVYVRPAHRGPAGPGAELMATAIAFAQDHIDVKWLTLGVHENNARALRFYQRIGFVMTEKVIPYQPDPAERVLIMDYPEFRF